MTIMVEAPQTILLVPTKVDDLPDLRRSVVKFETVGNELVYE